jgi:hypothetical protein
MTFNLKPACSGSLRLWRHYAIACLLLYEDYVWVSLGKCDESKAKQTPFGRVYIMMQVLPRT